MSPLFLRLPEKGLIPKWTIYKHVSNNSKKCLSVGNFGILSVVYCLRPEIFTKSTIYIIQDYPNMTGFLIFETLCLGRSKTLSYVWKKYHKNERHLCLVRHSYIKFSQNKCLNNTNILTYLYASSNCKLWNALAFIAFFWVFSYIIDDHSCLDYCIFTKLSQIVWLINIWYTNVLNVTAGCGRFSNLIAFSGYFHILLHVWNVIN